jgi:plastocyanin
MPKNRGRMRRSGIHITLAALLAAAPAAAIAGQSAVKAALAPTTVAIDAHAFAPAILTITAGTTVTWKNGDDTVHSIVADNKSFRSGALDTDDKWSHTFATPGEYGYFCSLHPYMVGKIVVKPAGKSS